MLSIKIYAHIGRFVVLSAGLYLLVKLCEPLLAEWLRFTVPLLERLLG